jgi:SAM-dependent methyltransferase
MQARPNRWARLYEILPADSFCRPDEQEDALFYEKPRLLPHLDSRALATVERVIATLIVEDRPDVLDLMASFDSHIPESVEPASVVGLGLNAEELERNEALDEYVIHDLNVDPTLPFEKGRFDVVLNTVSVDYLTRPVEAFREVGRVLRPGGLHLVLFSNRMFPTKAVRIWQRSSEAERIWLVEDFFRAAGLFGEPRVFSSQGHPRPADDPYAGHGIPSDPVFAVYAEREGGATDRPGRAELRSEDALEIPEEVLERRKREVRESLRCPYCEEPLEKFEVSPSPFLEWDNEFFYVCFNNQCPYMRGGWNAMSRQGNQGFTYRLMYDPIRDLCRPTPVASPYAQSKHVIAPRG